MKVRVSKHIIIRGRGKYGDVPKKLASIFLYPNRVRKSPKIFVLKNVKFQRFWSHKYQKHEKRGSQLIIYGYFGHYLCLWLQNSKTKLFLSFLLHLTSRNMVASFFDFQPLKLAIYPYLYQNLVVTISRVHIRRNADR